MVLRIEKGVLRQESKEEGGKPGLGQLGWHPLGTQYPCQGRRDRGQALGHLAI